jgi:polar amino acid transport system ATP-binding protein
MKDKDSNEVIVKFEDVTKQYGDLVVLDKLNLEIKKTKWFQLLVLQVQEKLLF